MTCDNSLFKVDSLTVDGVALAIEDGSATIEGVARYTNETVVSASGADFTKRKRVPTMINARIQFGPKVNPDDLAKICGAQIVLRDQHAPRRAVANKCSFASMGRVGDGAVDISFNVLEPIQWL
jgi:hypothetical protein